MLPAGIALDDTYSLTCSARLCHLIPMTCSVTVTQVLHGHGSGRPRSLSLALVGKQAQGLPATHSFLQRLPSELVTSIVELALLSVKPIVLATVSRAVHEHVNEVLYRTIVLSSADSIRHLHETSFSSPHLLLLVKKLVLSYESPRCDYQIGQIVRACKNLHSLRLPHLLSTPGLEEHTHLEEITIRSFVDPRVYKEVPMGPPTALRRLRLGEPSEFGWVSPREMLSGFGHPEALTHLQLSRKAGANEDNDRAFRDEVAEILGEYTELKVIVVSIYQGHAWESTGSVAKESYMWKIMEEAGEADKRVVIVEGQRGEWEKEDKDFQHGDGIDSRFWARF